MANWASALSPPRPTETLCGAGAASGHIVEGGAGAVAEPTARDQTDAFAGDPCQTGWTHTVVTKAVNDKPAAVRWHNNLNDMMGGRQVMSVTMPRIACFVCKGCLTKEQRHGYGCDTDDHFHSPISGRNNSSALLHHLCGVSGFGLPAWRCSKFGLNWPWSILDHGPTPTSR